MVLSNTRFPEENPFYRIKVRQIFLCVFLLTFGIGIQLIIISSIFKFDYKDPIFNFLFAILLLILAGAWLLRQCKLVGINLKQLIGKVPSNYQWLPLVGLVIARILFSRGAFRLSYYPLSFLAPSFVESILNDNLTHNIFLVGAKTFSPGLYYLLIFLYLFIINPVFETVIFWGIFLHRLAAKWGSRPAILALCIFFGALNYKNSMGEISYVLICTLLYINTRTLLVPIIANILGKFIYIFLDLWEFFTIASNPKNVRVLEQFRSEWKIGAVFLILSTPGLVYFIYKSWPRPNEPLPYFANALKK